MMKFRVRYVLVMLIFLVSAVVNLDRTNIAIAGSYPGHRLSHLQYPARRGVPAPF